MEIPVMSKIAMADRILVMHEGAITAEIARAAASEEAVMFAATGQADGGATADPGGHDEAASRQNDGHV